MPTLTASYSGFVNDDTPASLSTLPVLGTTATVSSDVSGNPYTITASGAVDNNYTISYVAGSLTITPAGLTITADNQTSVYGAGLPVLTASYSGFVAGDTAANLSTAPTLTTMATASSRVGSYDISASGAVDPDYTIAYVDGSLSITPASLTITADNQTNVYGATLPTLTASYTGFVNGDTSASLTTLPTLSTTATSASHVGDGPYAITASNAVDADYSITYVEGSLTVTAASLLITADNQTKVYGAALPTLTASYTGFVNGDTALSLTTQPSLSTTATAASDAGGYTITASGAVDSDYSISYASGTLTITQAALTITADDQSKVYGEELPTLTASYSGFVNGDTAANLDIGPTLSTTATTNSDVGVYSITVSGAADVDYTITFVSGTLTVTSAALTITADNQTKVYGAALPMLTASYSGFVNGDTSASLTTLPTVTTTATASSDVLGSPYSITASGAADANYTITYVAGTLTVTPATLTVIADNQTTAYGSLPALTVSYNGFVNGDSSASLTTQPALTTTATAGSHVSGNPYTITASGAADPDYSISYIAGTLTVTPVALTITADNQTKVYGGALPVLTASYTGFVNDDTASSLDTLPTLSTTATIHSNTGTYAIAASAAADPDYVISYVAGILTVTQANLTVTADDQTRPQGEANPPLTYSYSGFVNGDTPSVVSGAPRSSRPLPRLPARMASTPSRSPLVPSSALNYDFITIDGILTVANTPATTITLSASPGSTSTYGQALTFTSIVSPTMLGNPTPTGTVQFDVDGTPLGVPVTLVNGSATSGSLSTLDAGSHSIEAIYSGDVEYATNSHSSTQTVNPRR